MAMNTLKTVVESLWAIFWAVVFYTNTALIVYALDTTQEESLSMQIIDDDSDSTLKITPKGVNDKSNMENKTTSQHNDPNRKDNIVIKKAPGKTLEQTQESYSSSKEHAKQMRSMADEIKSHR